MIVSDSSPRWLPLVLAPAAFLGWIGLLCVLAALNSHIARIKARRDQQPISEPDGRPRQDRQPIPRRRPAQTRRGNEPDRRKHLYSAADVNRGYVIAVVGLVGGGLAAVAVVLLFPSLNGKFAAFLGAIAGSVLSLVIVFAYEKRAWRWLPMAYLPYATMPDLNGKWDGYIEIKKGLSEEKKIGKPIGCHVLITQDWSRVAIAFNTVQTESWSVMATIDRRKVHYEYYVVMKADAPPDPDGELEHLEPHYGMARLTPYPTPVWRSRCVKLDGIWFNDQHFRRWGDIHLSRTDAAEAEMEAANNQQRASQPPRPEVV